MLPQVLRVSSMQLVQLALQLESSTQVKERGSTWQEGCSKMVGPRLEDCMGQGLQLGCCRGVEMSLQEQTASQQCVAAFHRRRHWV